MGRNTVKAIDENGKEFIFKEVPDPRTLALCCQPRLPLIPILALL